MAKKLVRSLLLMALAALVLSGTAMAISMFTKEVAGLGKLKFTDEVAVVEIRVESLAQVRVQLESKATTQKTHLYTCYLYLDDVRWTTGQQVSWANAEVPGTRKWVQFAMLNLAAVSDVDAEVWP